MGFALPTFEGDSTDKRFALFFEMDRLCVLSVLLDLKYSPKTLLLIGFRRDATPFNYNPWSLEYAYQ